MMNVYLKILLLNFFFIHTLVDQCSHFIVYLFKYSDDKTFGFENDNELHNNFYKKVHQNVNISLTRNSKTTLVKQRDCHSYTLMLEALTLTSKNLRLPRRA